MEKRNYDRQVAEGQELDGLDEKSYVDRFEVVKDFYRSIRRYRLGALRREQGTAEDLGSQR